MAIASKGEISDSIMLKPLIKKVIKFLNIYKIIGDSAYSSRKNIQFLSDLGIEPIIFPKKSARRLSKGYPAWRKLILEFIELGEKKWIEEKDYKLRLNSESIFNALKLKFGNILFSKSYKMLFKEILAKVIAHNIFVLASLI